MAQRQQMIITTLNSYPTHARCNISNANLWGGFGFDSKKKKESERKKKKHFHCLAQGLLTNANRWLQPIFQKTKTPLALLFEHSEWLKINNILHAF